VATSAYVTGTGGNAGDGSEAGLIRALAQAREEAATLREVLEAITEALNAATARLDALEAQVNAEAGEAGYAPEEPATLIAPPIAPLHASPRTSGWRRPNWPSAPGGTSAAGAAGNVVCGETLRLRREALGISQAAVAHAAHCSRGLVAEVERGKRRSAQTLAHLANVLDRLEQQARRN
jgi:hypothetical protein